jgi:hypothetical protein
MMPPATQFLSFPAFMVNAAFSRQSCITSAGISFITKAIPEG